MSRKTLKTKGFLVILILVITHTYVTSRGRKRMLYNYKEAIVLYGNDYNLKKAISEKQFFKIEKGIYSDEENNFTLVELILKKYSHAFLVKDSALYLIGFIKEEPQKIHVGTARNALRIKDKRVQQHFYNSLDISVLKEFAFFKVEHLLSCENIQKYVTENNNEIRLFNLKALFFDVLRNYKNYKKETLLEILEKFKTCSLFNDLNEEDVAYNLYRENIGSCIDLLDDDLYKLLEDVFSEVFHRKIFLDFDI